MGTMSRAFAGAMLAVMLSATPAQAEITNDLYSSFTAAFTTDDVAAKRSAAEAMAAAAKGQPDHPQAAMIAYEAAWGFCLINACEEGGEAAAFALEQPDTQEYPVMGERQMLVAYIDWRTDPKRATRKALDEALEQAESLPASRISLGIFAERMRDDSVEQDWTRLRESAGAFARHLEPVNSVLPELWVVAALKEQIADFNRNQKQRVEPALAQVQGKLALALQDADPAVIESVEPRHWEIEAWRSAIQAYFLSLSGERPTPEGDIDAILEQYPPFPNPPEEDEGRTEKDERPFCEGAFNMSPPLRYGARQARRGQVGSVYAKLSIEDGLVSEVEILASVPVEGFRGRAKETIEQWRWVADEDQAQPDCKMSRSNIVLPIVFALD